jgi:hypothetical protein
MRYSIKHTLRKWFAYLSDHEPHLKNELERSDIQMFTVVILETKFFWSIL